MILIIDHYDSFTHNLLQYFGELEADPYLVEHDQITLAEVEQLQPQAICLSPGPGAPCQTKLTQTLLRLIPERYPILGICLGHQTIGEVFGARVIRAQRPLHGKTSLIYHQRDPLFRGIPTPFEATRYHSLLLDPTSIPSTLSVTATTAEGEIMGIKHRQLPIWGIQFHPESILTKVGKQLLSNFLKLLEKKIR